MGKLLECAVLLKSDQACMIVQDNGFSLSFCLDALAAYRLMRAAT